MTEEEMAASTQPDDLEFNEVIQLEVAGVKDEL